MTYQATVIQIMIASPGDVSEAREVTRDTIHEWNYINSSHGNVVLMPVGWETHSSPELAGRPQEIINERLLKSCDLLVGIFWTRLGTPTGLSASGTVEEIQRHWETGKPTMVYFSAAPVAPQSINPEQFKALQEFRSWCEPKGLVETFDNITDFRQKFTRQLQIAMKQNNYLKKIFDVKPNVVVGPQVPLAAIGPIQRENEPLLSSEASELLIHASIDDSGMILMVDTLGGRYVQSNGKTFGDPGDRRSMARWKYAVEQLLNESLIEDKGWKGEVFEVTDRGYKVADALRTEIAIAG